MNRRPLHVLFLVESLSGGGAEKVLSDLIRGLDKKRFDVTVCTVVDCGPHRDEVKRHARYRTIVGGKGLLYRLKYALVYRVLPARWIYRWWIAGDYDVEVAFTEGFPTRLLAAAANKKAARIAWVHVDLEARPWTQGLVFRSLEEERDAYARFQRVVHVSGTVRDAFERRFGEHPGSVVLFNPVHREQVLAKAASESDVPDRTRFRFLSVGRLEKEKGFDRLLAAFARVMRGGRDAELVILGEGPLRAALEQQASDLNIFGSLLLPGYKENPYPWMASADLFVCSSRCEGMSTVVTEALILGIPVLAVECSGIQEQLGEGSYGRIVANDTDALFGGMEDFISGTEPIEKWRAAAAEGGRCVSYRETVGKVEQLLEGTP